MKSNVVFSHNSDDWRTPSILYNFFIGNGFIDPCPYKSKVDNYGKIYVNKKIFVNPPYSHIKEWCSYCEYLCNCGNLVYLLIPSRTDTKYFHHLRPYMESIWFFEGRLKFNDSNSAPFPSILIKLSNNVSKCSVDFGSLETFLRRGIL